MPKQPFIIEGFHGGINSNTDPRDIQNIESPQLQDVKIDKLGRLCTLGGVDINSSDSNTCSILANRGLFTMASDLQLDGGAGNETFIIAYDSTNNNFDIKDSEGWNTAQISSLDTTHPVFYVGDGNLRIGDGQLNNAGLWFGYISDERFDALNADSGAIGWRTEYSAISSPTLGRCLISTPFAGPDDTNTVNSTNSEYVGSVADSSSDAVARNMAVNLRVGVQFTEILPNTASGWAGTNVNLSDDTTHFPVFGDNNVKATSSSSNVLSIITEESIAYTISEDATFIVAIFISSAEYADLTLVRISHFTSGDASFLDFDFNKTEIEPDCWNFLVCSSSNITKGTASLGDTFNKYLINVQDSNGSAASPTYYVSGPVLSKDVSLTGFQVGTYTFFHSYLYDDEKQESLPFLFEDTDANNVNKIRIAGAPLLLNFDIYTNPCNTSGNYDISRRITGSRLYFKVQQNDNFYLIGELDFIDKGLKWLPDGDTIAYAMANTSNTSGTFLNKSSVIKGVSPANVNGVDTFRTINGFSGQVKSLTATYKTAVVHGRRSYIGNIKQINKTHPDRILKSQINKFDVFPDNMGKIDVVVNDGESIVKLEAFADRLLQFKEKTMYIINIAENIEFLEDTYVNKGCAFDYHVTKTDFGIAWFNEFGVYFYDGRSVENLLEKNGIRLISEASWSSFITDGEDGSSDDSDMSSAHIGYIPKKRQIIIKNENKDILLYDFVLKSWTKGINKITINTNMTNFAIDGSQNLIYLSNTDSDIMTFNPESTSSSNFSYKTKDIDFGQPAIRKKIYRVRLSYKGDASSLLVKYSINGDTDTLYNFEGTTSGKPTGSADTSPLENKSGDITTWYHAELKPATSSQANNIYSFQLHCDGTVGATFEINDITFIYRLKNVK